jgi:catechol 2,3-dioxygenase
VGLYHVAFEVPDKTAFAQAYQALHEAGVQPVLVDHLISHAMYFDDPDGNGLEIYVDTRTAAGGQAQWHGQNRRLSRDAVLAHLPGASDD